VGNLLWDGCLEAGEGCPGTAAPSLRGSLLSAEGCVSWVGEAQFDHGWVMGNPHLPCALGAERDFNRSRSCGAGRLRVGFEVFWAADGVAAERGCSAPWHWCSPFPPGTEARWPTASLGSDREAGAKATLGADRRRRRRKGGKAARTRSRAAALLRGSGPRGRTDTSRARQQLREVGEKPTTPRFPLVFLGLVHRGCPGGRRGSLLLAKRCLSPCHALCAHFGLVLTSAEPPSPSASCSGSVAPHAGPGQRCRRRGACAPAFGGFAVQAGKEPGWEGDNQRPRCHGARAAPLNLFLRIAEKKKEGKEKKKRKASTSSSETASSSTSSSSSSSSSSDDSSDNDSKTKKSHHGKKKQAKQKDKKKKKKKKKRIKKKSKKKSKEKAKEEKAKGDAVPGPSLEQWQKESLVDSGPGNDGLSLLLKPGHMSEQHAGEGCLHVALPGTPERCLRESGLHTGGSYKDDEGTGASLL